MGINPTKQSPPPNQADRIRALAAAASGVLLARDTEELQVVLRDAARTVLSFNAILLALYDPQADTLTYLDSYDDGLLDPCIVMPLAGTPASRVIHERRTLVTLSSTAPEGQGSLVIGTGRRSESIIRTPIIAGDEVLGMMSVQSYTPGLYDDDDVELLEVMASLAASAIRTMQLTEGRQLAEEQLRRSEEHLRSTFNAAAVGLLVVDMEGRPTGANPAALEFLGYSAEELKTKSFPEFTHPDDIDADWALFRELIEGLRKHYQIEKRFIRKQGDIVWGRLSAALVRDQAGAPLYATAVLEDITARKLVEDALSTSEERFRTVTESMSDIVSIFDAKGIARYHSPSYESLLGRSAAERLGRSAFEAIHPDDHAAVLAAITEVRAAPDRSAAVRSRLSHADGRWLTVDTRLTNLLSNPAIKGLVAVSRDVTAQSHAEEALLESEQRFRQVTEAIREVFWLSDVTTWQALYVSPAYEAILGFPVEEVYKDGVAWLAHVHPEDKERVTAALSGIPSDDSDLVLRIIRSDGEVRWISAKMYRIRNDEGKVYRIAGVADDITDRRQMEDVLQGKQRMEVVGQLAGGIAHEFNSILTGIRARAEFLLEGASGDDSREDAEAIIHASDHAAGLTRQLLAFSQQEIVQARILDLNDVVRAATPGLKSIAHEDITVTSELDAEGGCVNVDPSDIEQVLLNLVLNAREAISNGGAIVLKTERVDVTDGQPSHAFELEAGPYMLLSVSDTGRGMDESTRMRAFQPFFSKRASGRGVGLGLAIVHGIIARYRGAIHVESEVGRGTTVRIYLPVSTEASPPQDTIPESVSDGAGNTVLVVEDQAEVRKVVRRVLEKRGYRVLEASNGREALKIHEDCNGQIDLVLTDVVMPEMGGSELAAHLREIAPQLPVIYMSGYTEDEVLRRGVPGDATRLLQKPFTTNALADIVREVLTSTAAASDSR
jgi:two-component system cell cycle sensor histidine kinase/response regulator CckA